MNNFSENSLKNMVESYAAARSSGYVAKGFKKDVDNLLNMYYLMQTLKYEDFCQVWNKMHFCYIYCGRNIKSEIREFTEEVLHISKELVININNEFPKRIGALYLLYGLYFLQRVNNSVKIRMTSENFNIYLNLIAQLRNCEQLDALYIGCKLIVNRAFYCVLTPYNHGLHRSFRKYHDQTINIINADSFSLPNQIENITIKKGLIQALNQLNEHYHQVKCTLPGAVGVEPEESLKLVDKDFGSIHLKTIEVLLASGNRPSTSTTDVILDVDDPNYEESKKIVTPKKRDSIKKRRSLIKEKAFSTKTNTRKQVIPELQTLSPRKKLKKPNV